MFKKNYFRGIVSAICILLVTMFSSCGHRLKISDECPDIIKAYTAQKIKTTDPIRIEFTDAIGPADSVDSPTKGLITISPKIKGITQWADNGSTLEFIPEGGAFEGGKDYICTVHLDKIAKEYKKFTFSFSVMERAALLRFEGCYTSPEDPSTAQAQGRILFSEPVDASSVTLKMFSCSDRFAKLSVSQEKPDELSFVVSNLKRDKQDKSVNISFNLKEIGFPEKLTCSATVPGKDDFRMLSAEDTDVAEPYIMIRFSEPLDESQRLEGLIYLEETDKIRIERNSSEVKLFYDGTISRDQLTLVIEEMLRSADGRRLSAKIRQIFQSKPIPPQVELAVKGSILPDKGNFKLPFRAVNLAAVDIRVIKIYENNVLMFLQDNDLDGSYQLRRNGRLILKKTARLDNIASMNLHKWQDFSIDLTDLFKQEKGVIYHIQLSFRQEYSLYEKELEDVDFSSINSTISAKEMQEWDRPEPYYYSWMDYEDDNYNWTERDDPSKPSYYMNSNRFPELNLTASNIGIIAKYSDDYRLWTTTADIMTAEPLKDVEITAYNFQLQEVGRGRSDARGFADFEVTSKPYVLKASRGDAVSYLKLGDGKELSMSRFDISGKKLSKGLKGYIYGERGVWRPGDTLHLTLIIEDKNSQMPANHPAVMEVYTPEGQFYERKTVKESVNGFYPFTFSTREESPTGTWKAIFTVGGAQFTKYLPIETIKPNRLKINLNTQELLHSGEKVNIGTIESHWLTGPAAAGLETRVTMTLRPAQMPFKNYKDYTFANPLSDFTVSQTDIFTARLDSAGKATIIASLPESEEAPGLLSTDLVCRVAEPGGDENITANTSRFSPFASYVGVKLGEADFETDKNLSLPVVVVDGNGQKVSGHKLEYKIYRLEWSWWWEYNAEKLNDYVHGRSAKIESQGGLTAANGSASIPFRIDYPDWGKFLVLVKDTESGHQSGGVIFVDWPLWRGRSDKGDAEGSALLSFSTDKKSYQAGEEAKVYIPKAEGGRALVSLENGSGVISRNWVKTSGTEETTYNIKITEEMRPNFYVHITLLQPHNQSVNDLPVRMYGVQKIMVTNQASYLYPVIEAPDVIRPQTNFKVSVKEKNNRPMTYTLAIVDEGLLDITGFRTPDPWQTMNETEALGVRTWDIYDYVIGAYNGNFTNVLSIGGDMAIKGTKKENRFNPVVKFLGPFTLKKGTAVHNIELPMYVGSVRVMVVAGHSGAYGSADKSVTVRSPLMVIPTLPRVLGSGERVSLPVNVFAMENNVRDVNVKVSVSGPVKIEGSSSKSLTFRQTGDKLADFSLLCDAQAEGKAKVTVTATGGGHTASETIYIDVRNPRPAMLNAQTQIIDDGKSHSFEWQGFKATAGESVVLSVSSFPAIDFDRTFELVKHYAHLCTEQLSARALNLLYARRFLSDGSKKEAEVMIPKLLSELLSRQMADGGFRYWPGYSSANEWATSMAGQVLLEARRQGFRVSEKSVTSWIRFQKKKVNSYSHSTRHDLADLNQAYRLYTLALAEDADYAAMNRLRETENISMQAKFRLAAAYAIAGRGQTANELIGKSAINISSPSAGLETTFWSALRDKSMILETLVLSGELSKSLELAGQIAKQYNGGYTSTQEIAFTSIAMAALADAVGTDVSKVSYTQNGVKAVLSGAKAVNTIVLDSKSGKVTIENPSQSKVCANLLVKKRPDASETISAFSNGVRVTVAYVDMNGNRLNVKELPQGTDFKAIVTVSELTGSTSSAYMALTLPVASGWEIWNDRLYGGSSSSEYDYKDIRDDSIRWYFSLKAGSQKTFVVRLQANYIGEFILPEAVCEDMYNGKYRSNTDSYRVKVLK